MAQRVASSVGVPVDRDRLPHSSKVFCFCTVALAFSSRSAASSMWLTRFLGWLRPFCTLQLCGSQTRSLGISWGPLPRIVSFQYQPECRWQVGSHFAQTSITVLGQQLMETTTTTSGGSTHATRGCGSVKYLTQIVQCTTQSLTLPTLHLRRLPRDAEPMWQFHIDESG